MPLEAGGRADKAGNRYEIKCIIYELLKLINERNRSVVIESIGDDEKGTDILVTDLDGIKEHQQCKIRNAAQEYWSFSNLKNRKIFNNWKIQLERDENRKVSLISPIGCSNLVDLCDRARNTNGVPFDFYKYQIEQCNNKFRRFYHDFCTEMNLDYDKEIDIAKSIAFLKRIQMKQMPEHMLKESIDQEINWYFLTDKDRVYNAFIALIIDGDICGKEITSQFLFNYFAKQKIELRLIAGDERILPNITKINQEYKTVFKSLKEGLINRSEFQECIDNIESEKSFIISGNAGCGKSGCTEAIINHCVSEEVPYIAIKLDRRIPHGNCESWGKELGFPGSISYALDSVSEGRKAVILLDQLDALRWTQANSGEAISVCMELIKQVGYLNLNREKKIIVVFVCRKYDLDNDNNIGSLFKNTDVLTANEWITVEVNEFNESTVKSVVGSKYDNLTNKLKQLLRIPSNLYIWQHLSDEEMYDNCTTTSHLIDIWFQQICRKCCIVNVSEKIVRDTLNTFVTKIEQIGRLYAPKSILDLEEAGLDYLVSVEILSISGNKVGFVHQSILDYFISKRMADQYFCGENIDTIIGEKCKQTPTTRYQVQMFLQNLLECDTGDFLAAGNSMLESEQIRYYIKFVFYEILGQIKALDIKIIEFIKHSCEDDKKREYLINNVFMGNKPYIAVLRDCNILEKWFSTEKDKKDVFRLLASINRALDSKDVAFIRNRAFINDEDDREFFRCFWHDITQESDELFELRMEFFEKYPKWAQESFIDIKSLMKSCEERTIKLFSFWLRNKIYSKAQSLYNYEEKYISSSDIYLLENGTFALDELLQYIPRKVSPNLCLSEWSNGFFTKNGLERAVVELIKKANIAVISKDPELFWEYYSPYLGKNYDVFNEIILHGFCYMPQSYSNRIIEYLANDLNKTVFEYTSGEESELTLAQCVIKKHSATCDKECLDHFLKVVEYYVSSNAKEWYRDRIEQNKLKNYYPIYWSFWGDLQYELLQCVHKEQLSERQRNLLQVLKRRFDDHCHSRYSKDNDVDGGWVKSPISGKKLSPKQWLGIITNKTIQSRGHGNWKAVEGGYIESSIETFSHDFQNAVMDNPEEMIRLVLEYKYKVVPAYINFLYLGASLSKNTDQIEQQLWEKLFKEFPCDLEDLRAHHFCGILEKLEIYDWSQQVLDQLKVIALNYDGGTFEQKNKSCDGLNSEQLYGKALNCVKGNALRAIGHLLWENKDLFQEFKSVIDALSMDESSAVRMASLFALWPIYNIDRDWAEAKILNVYESDTRTTFFSGTRGMFFRLYPKYREQVLALIMKCFESEDTDLIKVGGYSICEFFIIHNEFEDVVANNANLSEEQIKAILYMAVIYLKDDMHREKSKEIILNYKDLDQDMSYPLGNMFHENFVDLNRDSDFLTEIMKSNVSRRMIHSFTSYLQENACSVKAYAEIIIALCDNILSMSKAEIDQLWGIDIEISKLVIALYDETVNSDIIGDSEIAEKCLDLWDIMYEKQIGHVREISHQLMER